jgi:Spy/CpxP family protein refolding chaperone
MSTRDAFARRVDEEPRMRKTGLMLVLGLVMLGLAAHPALAQHREMGGPTGRGPGLFSLLFKGADLTADQKSKIRELLAAHRTGTRALLTQLRTAREELTDKLFAPGALSAADLQPLHQRIAELEERLAQDRLAAALEIRALLGPEQIAKAQKLKDRFRELHAQMQALFEGTTRP